MKDPFSRAGQHGYYKPVATRAAFLICLLVITLSLIALTEYALHIIPNHTGTGKLGNVVGTLKKLDGRDITDAQQHEASIQQAPPSLTRLTQINSIFEGLASSSTTESIEPTETATGGGLILGGSSPTGQPQGGGLILGGDTTTPTTPTIPTTLITPETVPTSPPIVVNTLSITPDVPAASPPPDSIAGAAAPSVTAPPFSRSITPADSSYSNVGGSATLAPPGEPSGGYLITGTAHSGKSSVPSNSGSPASDTFQPTATVVNANGTFLSWSDGSTSQAPQIDLQQYILVAFLPLILSVLYTMPWRILDTAIREMEPFYQLHYAGGALAETSLCLDYSTSLLATMPFKSLRNGHMYVFWSSLISIAVLVLTPLSAEVFFVSLSGECHADAPKYSCHAAWGVYTTLARVLQGILAFIGVLITLVLIFGFNRKSGVYSEPFSIAGKAVLLHKSPVIHFLRNIDDRISSSDLKLVLKGKRFGTAPFTSNESTQCYGILPVDPEPETGSTSESYYMGQKGPYSRVETTELPGDHGAYNDVETVEDKSRKRTSTWDIIAEKLYIVSALILFCGVFILVAYYHYTTANTGFERFMDSEGFGIRFMLTTIGVIIRLFWSNIDENLRRMEPYRRLLLGGARPEDSILVPVWMSPISAIIPSLRRSHFLVALISLVSVLSEFLPIALAASTFSAANTPQALEVCSYIALAILLLMIISVLMLIFRSRHHIRPLPRPPTILASALLYITYSGEENGQSMLDSFQGLAMVSKRERNEYIRNLRAVYTMGLVAGNNLRIDEDRNVHGLWTD